MAATRAAGRRVVAIGTTSTRVLETAARDAARAGWSDLYITPPFAFAAVGALVTNFHLPRSSLLLLVTAFVQHGMPIGTEAAPGTRHARRGLSRGAGDRLSFFSFGDAMLIR